MGEKLTRYGAYRVEVFLVDRDTGERQRVRRPFERVRQRDDRPWTIVTASWSQWHKALVKLDRRTDRTHI